MRSGRVAGAADEGDDVSCEDRLADGDEDVGAVTVSCKSVCHVVIQEHLVPVPVPVIAALNDDAVKEGCDRGSIFVTDVYACMEGIISVDWMISPSEVGGDGKIRGSRDIGHEQE